LLLPHPLIRPRASAAKQALNMATLKEVAVEIHEDWIEALRCVERSGLRSAAGERANPTPTDNHHLKVLFAELDAHNSAELTPLPS
jgi:hypothetical protein